MAVVTPDFFRTLLERDAKAGALFDRLARIIGTPGSGKTTLAKIMQFENAAIVARRRDDHKDLHEFLEFLGVVERGQPYPARMIVRLPMESEYRDFWELPYDDNVKNDLLLTFIQSRAVLGWLSQLEQTGTRNVKTDLLVSTESPAAISAAGASSLPDLREKAEAVESSIYKIVGSLIPPALERVPEVAIQPFAPFSVLQGFTIGGAVTSLGIILDDFHLLHAHQRRFIYRALTRRQLSISRWIMMRYDALSVPRVLGGKRSQDDELPSDVDKEREITEILMQEHGSASKFSRAAPKMADQQLGQIALLANHGVSTLSQVVSAEPSPVSPRALEQIEEQLRSLRRRSGISDARVSRLRETVRPYVTSSEQDVEQRAMAILIERYVRRVPQVSLLEEVDSEPSRPVAADAETVDAARLQLMHDFGRPYFYGLDTLASAANGNAEQYLRLCAPLIDALETQLIQRRGKRLSAAVQHERLRRTAKSYIDAWTFPENQAVRKLVAVIADAARGRTLERTAPVSPGVNAVGINADEFSQLLAGRHPRLAHVLKYAIAYNAIILDESGAKGKDWVLLRLSGLLCIAWGLPFVRHKFVDSVSLDRLAAALGDV